MKLKFRKKKKKNNQQVIYNEFDRDYARDIDRQHKKAKKNRRLKVLMVFLLLAMIAAYLVSDISRMQSIKIVGNDSVPADYIKRNCGVNLHHDFILTSSSSKIEKTVEKLALVKSASVSKSLLGNVTITIKEKNPIAYGQMDDDYYLIDDEGNTVTVDKSVITAKIKRLPQITSPSKNKLLLYADENLSKETDLNKIRSTWLKEFAVEFAKLSSSFRTQVSDVSFSPLKGDSMRCTFRMTDGKKCYLRIDEMVEQLKNNFYDTVVLANQDAKVFDFVGGYVYASKK